MRLIVDTDETMILWRLPSKIGEVIITDLESADPNPDVIEFIRRWVGYNPLGKVIVWSGGGKDHAAKWAQRCLAGVYYETDTKHEFRVLDGDLFIDDDPLPFYRHVNIHPDMLKGLHKSTP